MGVFYAGIDEAGYGPLLGPLCVGCAVFELPDAATHASDAQATTQTSAEAWAPPCLWTLLRAAVCRAGNDRRRRIAVNDSKKLKGAADAAAHPLRHLERGVTAFAAAAAAGGSAEGALFQTDDALLGALGAPLDQDGIHSEPLGLPLGNEAVQLRIAAATLRTALARAGVTMRALRVRAISARDFNQQAARVENKATINWMAAMLHVDAVRRMAAAAAAQTPVFIALDQHGGRHNYVRPLGISFPDARIRVLDEGPECARYQLEFPAGDGLPAHALTVSFEQGGECQHLPVALASMAAKFVRELHMRRLNTFFARHLPELKETAGYVEDGRRFLGDVEPVIERLGLDRSGLVRSR